MFIDKINPNQPDEFMRLDPVDLTNEIAYQLNWNPAGSTFFLAACTSVSLPYSFASFL